MLCYDLADADEIDRFFDETMIELSHDPRMWVFFKSTTGMTVAADYIEFPAAYHVTTLFYKGRELTEVIQTELDSSNHYWRAETGTPIVYTKDLIDNRRFRIYPKDSGAYVAGDITYLYAAATTSNIPEILEVPLALFILAREFSRESNHRDTAFSQACNKLGNEILEMVA